MKIGITLAALRPSLWTEATLLADELGFESVWMPEHLVIPVELEGSPIAGADHPPVPSDVPVFEVFSYLSFLAGQWPRRCRRRSRTGEALEEFQRCPRRHAPLCRSDPPRYSGLLSIPGLTPRPRL